MLPFGAAGGAALSPRALPPGPRRHRTRTGTAFVYSEQHRQVLRRRREWFDRMGEAYLALWWIPRGQVPTTADAEDRIRHLRAHGPTARAFTLRVHFRPPGNGEASPRAGRADWMCPA